MTEVGVLLLSAGRGPAECAWAVTELLRRLESEAASGAVSVRRLESVPGPKPGTHLSVLLEISGRGAVAFTESWTGTLCWQAPSPYRPGHGRKNWYVVAERQGETAPATTFDEGDVDVVPVRTGGPGGQHRNKASTAVRATHRPTGFVVVADEERYFTANRRLALQRLRTRIEDGNEAVERSAVAARRGTHDQLIRGNPARVERPGTGSGARMRG
ncbi:peptide chain release factor H [Winogradskya consettensis]|uniref:Peptide chain release factor H n=1 Tax=Winogradskya consettensis TaxID=113560 RepID=A0A919VMJ2_9ACTN|nr:peptide chain release factor H [Actinoplanes consettensis]GIM71769.1 peptide chain release factor H [Actinoplanes consettensis]